MCYRTVEGKGVTTLKKFLLVLVFAIVAADGARRPPALTYTVAPIECATNGRV